MNQRSIRLFLLVAVFSTSCAPPRDAGEPTIDDEQVVEAPRHALVLERTEADTVELVLSAGPKKGRVLEVVLGLSNASAFQGAIAGDATEQAQKDLVVQQREPGKVRLIVYSGANTNELESGTIATLHLNPNGATGRIEILEARLAPAAANEGLVLGVPLDL